MNTNILLADHAIDMIFFFIIFFYIALFDNIFNILLIIISSIVICFVKVLSAFLVSSHYFSATF